MFWLGRRASDVLRSRTLGALADFELDTVALTKVVEPLALHRALVEEVFLPESSLMKPNPLSARNVLIVPVIVPPSEAVVRCLNQSFSHRQSWQSPPQLVL
jgi:hypothetical protein